VTEGGDARRPVGERAPSAWTVRESRTLVHDRWLSLRAQTVVTGEGAVLAPFYLLDFPDWAQVVALTPDDRIVLVRQYRHGIGRVTLELPGGIVDPGETPLEAAAKPNLVKMAAGSSLGLIDPIFPGPRLSAQPLPGAAKRRR